MKLIKPLNNAILRRASLRRETERRPMTLEAIRRSTSYFSVHILSERPRERIIIPLLSNTTIKRVRVTSYQQREHSFSFEM